jgi:hypothetical protein
MELYRAYLIQMSEQRKQTTTQLVVPDLDFIVVSSRHKEWLRQMEIDTSDWPVMLLKAINHRSNTVVPTDTKANTAQYELPRGVSVTIFFPFHSYLQLNDSIVQGRADPGPDRVKGESFDPSRFGFELGQHALLDDSSTSSAQWTKTLVSSDANEIRVTTELVAR